MKQMRAERAIEILDPKHREHYSDLPDGMEQVNEACRMGMEALQIIHAAEIKWNECEKPTNAEVLTQVLAEVVQAEKDEDGFPELDYETLVCLTPYISCPYTHNPLCALDNKNKENPDAYVDCDACKSHWLMEKWKG